MPKGGLSMIPAVSTNGDLLTVFKPVEETLSSYNSKILMPINLFNRGSRRVSYAILELLVESRRPVPEWRLKLDNISITRQFKPAYSIMADDGERGMHKFIYDVTSILNAHEIVDKEWVNILIKYEGGNPFAVKYILLDAIYEDQDAYTTYKHSSGLMLLENSEKVSFATREFCGKPAVLRLIAYTPKHVKVEITANNYKTAAQIPQERVEEYTLTLDRGTEFVEVGPSPEKSSPLVISSLTVYSSVVKQPLLELCGVDHSLEGNKLKFKLQICNKGESPPDKLIVSLMKRGNVLCSLQDSRVNIPPGSTLERVIEVPGSRLDEINIRLVWFKLTRRWMRDEVVKLR
ncbi:MAG: hypothetical protein QXT15_05145 [Desulfurococcaceae archaeon]